MSRVRYVCLSDLHLGDRDSILTTLGDGDHGADPTVAADTLVSLFRLVRRLAGGDRPTLVVNGDFLDLAFGRLDTALGMFERFVEVAMPPGDDTFDGMIYLPGNHDHHLWEITRETQYRVRQVGDRSRPLPPPRHTTSLDPELALPSLMLGDTIRRVYGDRTAPDLRIGYPNLGIRSAGGRSLAFHHGHFMEPLYTLLSRGRRMAFPQRPAARTVEEIETENFAWIDFVWSLLGRSGSAGQDAETIFEMLRYPERVQRFAAELAERAAPLVRMPFLPIATLRRIVLRRVLTRLARRVSGERTRRHEVCSPGAHRGLVEYLYGPLRQQFEDETGEFPDDLTLVIGHTHKPFETVVVDPAGDHPVRVVNTGGWTVDTATGSDAFGASIAWIGEDHEVATLRIFNDGPARCSVSGRIRVPAPGGYDGAEPTASDPLARRLVDAMESAPGQLGELGEQIHEAVTLRRQRHRERFG